MHLRDERDDLLFAAASAFYEIKSLEKDIEALEASKTRSDEHLRVLEVRRRAAEAGEEDVLLIEARRDETEARLIQARHDRERARARLSRLTGVESLPATLRDTYEVGTPRGEIPQLVGRALRERLDLAIARAEVESARSQRNLALSEYLPKVDLESNQWTRMEGGFQENLDWTIGVNLTWNLFDGGACEAELARTLSLIRKQTLALRAGEKEVRQEVEDAVLAFRSLDRSLASFESRVSAAQASEEVTRRQFQAGEATNLDVLVAQEAQEDSERNLFRARLARKLAALRIRLAVGDLRHVLVEDSR